ncbi:MAG: primase [Myxococcales bacterium]|nr:primase [Myxococcales bacterium]
MIPDAVITEIRERADIIAVIGQHVQLKKAGRNWKGLCPFHGEKTSSFNVSPDKGFYHCFGCQKHGDVFTFVMEIEGKSFVEAAEQLGARFGVVVPQIEESPELRKARGERVAMLDINRAAMEFFRGVLADPKRGEPGRAYLAKRGVGDAISEKFQLGYAPSDWHLLADYLKEKRLDLELAARLGLVAKQPRAGGYYDRYRDRLVCPVIVPGGEVTGFSARVIGKAPPSPDGSEPPKYINSPESVVYKKSKLLFGLAQAREGMQQNGRGVLVEGNFDVITLHQAGFTEVVAPLGTALTIEQVTTLKRLAERVVLVYDGDKAGYKATMHALQMCVEADVEVLVAKRPGNAQSGGGGILANGVDPDSLVAGGGAVQLREAIDRAQGGIEFFCFEVWSKARANSDARTRALEDAARLVAKIGSPLKRDMVIDTLAKALDIDTNIVRTAVSRASHQGGHAPRDSRDHVRQPSHPNAPARPETAPAAGVASTVLPSLDEVELIALLADHPELIASPEADKAFWLLTDGRLKAMYSAAREGKSLLESAPVELPLATAQHVLSGKYSDCKDPPGQLAAMARQLEQRKTKLDQNALKKSLVDAQRRGDRELARVLAQLAEAERKGDRESVERLTGQLSGVISSNRKQAE